jgi:hypothetical protein
MASQCGGVLDTSTVALRILEGVEKESGVCEYDCGAVSLGDIDTVILPSRLGVGSKAHDLTL